MQRLLSIREKTASYVVILLPCVAQRKISKQPRQRSNDHTLENSTITKLHPEIFILAQLEASRLPNRFGDSDRQICELGAVTRTRVRGCNFNGLVLAFSINVNPSSFQELSSLLNWLKPVATIYWLISLKNVSLTPAQNHDQENHVQSKAFERLQDTAFIDLTEYQSTNH